MGDDNDENNPNAFAMYSGSAGPFCSGVCSFCCSVFFPFLLFSFVCDGRFACPPSTVKNLLIRFGLGRATNEVVTRVEN